MPKAAHELSVYMHTVEAVVVAIPANSELTILCRVGITGSCDQ